VAETGVGEAYDRGVAAGEIAARLADHDNHFKRINGSLTDVANELHGLVLAVQRLGDQAVHRDATVIATAAALKDAEAARRDKAERSWTPLTRIYLMVAVVGAVVALYLAIRPH
jgi:hypothetical protein